VNALGPVDAESKAAPTALIAPAASTSSVEAAPTALGCARASGR
jgi:hypothetical protein